jgi:CRP-like cAMP-binding protein
MEHAPLDPLAFRQILQNYLFSSLSDQELAATLKHSVVCQLTPGEIVFRQGEPAARFFLVLSGVMRLYRLSPSGEEKVVDLVRSGGLFAEAVFFMGAHYPVHAAALDHVRLVCFEFEDLNACLKSSTDLSFRLMAGMAKRIHSLVNEIDRLTLGNACQRLAFYLLDNAQEDPSGGPVKLKLKVPKSVVAARIGVKPETLSRLFAKLKDARLLEVHDETVLIQDMDGLKALLSEGFS